MKSLTFGKLRGLEKCATTKGGLAILALDHRNNLRAALNPTHPELISNDNLSNFKLEVTKALVPNASSILLDPEVGAFQAIASKALPGKTGLIVALEATGYDGNPSERESHILTSWSVEKAKRMGADAVKLLVYYHPNSKKATQIKELVLHVADECNKLDMLFILEPLTYSINPTQKTITGDDCKQTVIETARQLTVCGGDILKTEFPLDIMKFPDKSDWTRACSELSESIHIPWVLLSASVDFDIFLKQVEIACRNGASGVAVGRAVWKEAAEINSKERKVFLMDIATKRMKRIKMLVESCALPFTKYYEAPNVNAFTYKDY